MKLVVSVREGHEIRKAEQFGADLIELRLDLLQDDPGNLASRLPRILTLRSSVEGGAFSGDPSDWSERITALARAGDHVDMEARFSRYAPQFRDKGISIIGSCHFETMPPREELTAIETRLRSYADIPKIVVTPSTEQDVLTLCSFTLEAQKPLATGVMGRRFAFARAILPFFGSELVYCHAGRPVAGGQFHIRDFRKIMHILTGGKTG
jgi:3-dehydroquinate dehydratase-1